MCDEVYAERNQLVAALSKVWDSTIAVDPDEPDWPVVLINSPSGQLSWHITVDERHRLFSHLYVSHQDKWDGHTTEEKYRRLNSIPILS
jgi:hypothetical protein